jgi:peptidoglycan/xylan/chitin deacetylase (PgdA/CDA1 family)
MRSPAATVRELLLRWRGRLSSTQAGVVLVYHVVGGPQGDEDVEILPAVSDEAFERELEHLRRRYRVVPAAEIVEAARRRRRGERFPVAITFDDDLSSHVSSALPALRKAGLTATFFVGGASLHRPHRFWWEDLQLAIDGRLIEPDGLPHLDERDVRAALDREPRAILDLTGKVVRLDPDERADVIAALRKAAGPPPPANSGLREADARSLLQAGNAIGFHTLDHDVLPSLTDAELSRVLQPSEELRAAVGGRALDLVAYPHGKADARVAGAARGAGFSCGFTTARGIVTPKTDPLLIPRTVADLSPDALALRLARAFGENPGA